MNRCSQAKPDEVTCIWKRQMLSAMVEPPPKRVRTLIWMSDLLDEGARQESAVVINFAPFRFQWGLSPGGGQRALADLGDAGAHAARARLRLHQRIVAGLPAGSRPVAGEEGQVGRTG